MSAKGVGDMSNVKISELTPDPNNANKGTQRGLKALDKSLRQYGAGRSILLDRDNRIIAGNKTAERAADIGLDDVIVVETDGTKLVAVKRTDLDLEDDGGKARALATYDNRVGQLDLDWDLDALGAIDADVLQDLWSDKELADLGVNIGEPPPDDPGAQIDKADELRQKWGVETGQLWRLGEHRLICGDCTDADVVARLMDGEKAQLCLTDPPYGLDDKKASGKNDYDQHVDTHDNLIELAQEWLPIARELCAAVVFSPGVTNAWIYPQADWVMCWFYGGGPLLSSWGFNCWQPFLCYGKDPSLASGNGGRPDAVDMNTPANADDIDHPCPKPMALWEWFINRLSFGKLDILYDPFSGSGTTLIACERLNRKCRAVEISPGYVAVAIQRWVDMTDGTPELIDN